jgi:hypothetical protein
VKKSHNPYGTSRKAKNKTQKVKGTTQKALRMHVRGQLGGQLIGAASGCEAFLGLVPEMHVLFAISPAEANDSAIDAAGEIDDPKRPITKFHAYGGQLFLATLEAVDALYEAVAQQVGLARRPAGKSRFEGLVKVQHSRVMGDHVGHDPAHEHERFVCLRRSEKVAPVIKAAFVFAS